MLVKEQAPAAEVEALETLLAVFGARTIGADAVRALMRRLFMSTEILETSPLYQEWIARGKAEGLAEGKVEAILTVLRARFGSVPPALEAAIRATPPATLDDLLTQAVSDTLEQLAARLGV